MINIGHKLSVLNTLAMKKDTVRSTRTLEKNVSVEQFKEMLITEGLNYTEEEIVLIRDFFYQLIQIELDNIDEYIEQKERKMTEDQNEYRQAS